MRYIDGPTTSAEARINAPVDVIWALITDINLPAKFSSEFQGAEWIDAAPAVGATFAGRNQHAAIGSWQTTCTVTRLVDHEVFEWCVGEPDNPSAKWRFTLDPSPDGVTLTQWMQMGPAPSGLTPAIVAMPDKEEKIIARRLGEHQRNMQANVDGVKQLAEDAANHAPTSGSTN